MPREFDPLGRTGPALAELRKALSEIPGGVPPSVAAALDSVEAAACELERVEARIALQQALLDERLLRVENNRIFSLWKRIVSAGIAWRRRFVGPARQGTTERQASDYRTWVSHEQAALPLPDEASAQAGKWTRQPLISVVVRSSNINLLNETLDSLKSQVYPHWECLVVSDGTSEITAYVEASGNPGRMRNFTAVDGRDGILGMTGATASAVGDYITFVDEGDRLSRFAMFFLAEAGQRTEAGLLYSDEDELDSGGTRCRPVFKPDWSPDLLTSTMYFGKLMAIDRALIQNTDLSLFADASLHALALQCSATTRVVHIPRVLCHRGSDSARVPSSSVAIRCAVRLRDGISVEVRPGPAGETWLTYGRPAQRATVSLIVCSRNPKLLARCLDSVQATAAGSLACTIVVCHEENGTNEALRSVVRRHGGLIIPYGGPFNFSRMNNAGAAAADTPFLLFLNDDIVATAPGWLELLVDSISTERVGVAGSVLWYPSGTIQHAGIVCGIGDGVGHAGRGVAESALWPWLLAKRNVSAVTGACLSIRRELFLSMRGFDESFPSNYNDVDLCLRVRERGLEVVCVPVPRLVHHECQTREGLVRFEERYRFHARWGHVMRRPDPYYSAALQRSETIALDLKHSRSAITFDRNDNRER